MDACTNGRWVAEERAPPYTVSAHEFHDLAHCQHNATHSLGAERLRFTNGAGWQWVVAGEPSCSDESGWCDAFDGRRLIFVGDSIMSLQLISLLHLLGAAPTRSAVNHGHHSACGGRVRFALVRNDWSCDPSWSSDCRTITTGVVHRLEPFARFGDARAFDTLVMNSGTHMHVLSEDTQRRYSRLLTRWLNASQFARIVWRTSTPGHVNCTQHDAPLNVPYTPPPNHVYRWDTLASLDAMRRAEFGASLAPGRVQYLDAAAITNLRADRHAILRFDRRTGARAKTLEADCLHYCLPGPYDAVNMALKAMLVRSAKADAWHI
jgi:hypothetical protein